MWPILLLLAPSVLAVPAFKKCVNGTLTDGKCICNFSYTGVMCHRFMHCDTLDKREDGSCFGCLEGWRGNDCDKIDCGLHGQPNYDMTTCNCTEPYSGLHCTELHKDKVLYYYNNKVSETLGPIGIIFAIPAIILIILCNKDSKRRRSRKVEAHLESHINQDLDSDLVHKLLYSKE